MLNQNTQYLSNSALPPDGLFQDADQSSAGRLALHIFHDDFGFSLMSLHIDVVIGFVARTHGLPITKPGNVLKWDALEFSLEKPTVSELETMLIDFDITGVEEDAQRPIKAHGSHPSQDNEPAGIVLLIKEEHCRHPDYGKNAEPESQPQIAAQIGCYEQFAKPVLLHTNTR